MSQHPIDINVPAFKLFVADSRRAGTPQDDGRVSTPDILYKCMLAMAKTVHFASYEHLLDVMPRAGHAMNIIFPTAHRNIPELIEHFTPVHDIPEVHGTLKVNASPVPAVISNWAEELLALNGLL